MIHCSVLTPVCANASLAQCVCSPRERREQLPPPAPARMGHEAAACQGRGRPRQGERGRPQRLSADICTYSQCILQNHRFIFPKCAFIQKLVFFNERNLETNSEKTTEFSYKRSPSTGSTTTLSHPKPSSPSNTRDHGSEAAGAAAGRHGAAPGTRRGRARHGSGRAACFRADSSCLVKTVRYETTASRKGGQKTSLLPTVKCVKGYSYGKKDYFILL